MNKVLEKILLLTGLGSWTYLVLTLLFDRSWFVFILFDVLTNLLLGSFVYIILAILFKLFFSSKKDDKKNNEKNFIKEVTKSD